MDVKYIAPEEKYRLEEEIIKLETDSNYHSALLFIADNNKLESDLLSKFLLKTAKPIIGGVFPEIIYRGERKISGTLLVKLNFKIYTQLFDLTNNSDSFMDQLKKMQTEQVNTSGSLFVFSDALSAKKDDFIESLFNYFGIKPTYFGGGAGSLNFIPFPSILGNGALHENAAVIGWTDKKIALGVAHGWQSISSPLKVTKADRNKIESINWKPAFEVYKQIVEEHSDNKFTNDNFFDIAKSYPLGISKIDAEMVVRDPYMMEDNSLYLVDIVKEGEYINVLHGDMESLIEGAEKASEIAFSKIDDSMNNDSVFCIDCISRVLFMQNSFNKELDVIGRNKQVNGILSIGEIANSEESYLEIYNKTVVVGIW